MDVSISSRHLTVTPKLEEAIRTKIGHLDRFLPELDTATVHLDEARNPRITNREVCEVTLSGHGHRLRCKVQAPDPLTAVDRAEAKLERQIRKLRTKLQKRHHGRGDTIRNPRRRSRGAVGRGGRSAGDAIQGPGGGSPGGGGQAGGGGSPGGGGQAGGGGSPGGGQAG